MRDLEHIVEPCIFSIDCSLKKCIYFLLQIKELQENLVDTQLQLDRVTRDKVTLMSDLEATKGHLSSSTIDYGQVIEMFIK